MSVIQTARAGNNKPAAASDARPTSPAKPRAGKPRKPRIGKPRANRRARRPTADDFRAEIARWRPAAHQRVNMPGGYTDEEMEAVVDVEMGALKRLHEMVEAVAGPAPSCVRLADGTVIVACLDEYGEVGPFEVVTVIDGPEVVNLS